MKSTIKMAVLCTVCACLITSCAEFKNSGRAIGHATRDTTKAIGHGVRDSVKAIGHDTKKVMDGKEKKQK